MPRLRAGFLILEIYLTISLQGVYVLSASATPAGAVAVTFQSLPKRSIRREFLLKLYLYIDYADLCCPPSTFFLGQLAGLTGP